MAMQSFRGQVRSVTANVAKKVVTVSFAFELTDESMQTAEELGFLANKMPVTVVVTPGQMTMELKKKAAESGE